MEEKIEINNRIKIGKTYLVIILAWNEFKTK
jgi:hypothetical protein